MIPQVTAHHNLDPSTLQQLEISEEDEDNPTQTDDLSDFHLLCRDDLSVPSPGNGFPLSEFADFPTNHFSQIRGNINETDRSSLKKIIKGALIVSTASLALMNIAFYGYHLTSYINVNGNHYSNHTLSLVENYKFNNINMTAFLNSFNDTLQDFQEKNVLLYSERMFINAFSIVSLALSFIPTPQRFAGGFKVAKLITGIGMLTAGSLNIPKHFIFASPLFASTGLLLAADALSCRSIKLVTSKLKNCCSRISNCFRCIRT